MTKWKCRKCPPGASCAGSITQDGIKARFGWWRESKSSKVFFQCLKPSACLGAPNPSLETQFLDARKDNKERCQLKTYKASRLCAACRAGYARGNGDGSCNRCKNGFWNAVEFVVAVVVGTLFLLFLVRVTVFKPRVVRLSDGIKKIGLSYVKLQTYKPDTLTVNSKRKEFKINQNHKYWGGQNLYDLYSKQLNNIIRSNL